MKYFKKLLKKDSNGIQSVVKVFLSLENVGNFWKGLRVFKVRETGCRATEGANVFTIPEGQDMQQRPGGARLATEIDVSALDRSRELIVTQSQRAGAKARKETFNQSWDD